MNWDGGRYKEMPDNLSDFSILIQGSALLGLSVIEIEFSRGVSIPSLIIFLTHLFTKI